MRNVCSANLTLTGNEFANALYSEVGSDTLAGLGGDDRHYINDALDNVKEAV